jgi:hypothetical protein
MSLNARVVAIQGLGFSPIYVAVQGLLDYIAAGGSTGSRMRSTTKLRLGKIRDVRQTLGHAVAAAHAHPLTARIVLPQPVTEIFVGPLLPGIPELARARITEIVLHARVQVIGSKAVSQAHGLNNRVGCRTAIIGCRAVTAARTPTPRADVKFVMLSACAQSQAGEFDDVYAEIDDDEDLLLLAAEFI